LKCRRKSKSPQKKKRIEEGKRGKKRGVTWSNRKGGKLNVRAKQSEQKKKAEGGGNQEIFSKQGRKLSLKVGKIIGGFKKRGGGGKKGVQGGFLLSP